MRRIATAVLLAAGLALAGCSSSGSHDDKPTPTITVTKTPTLSAAQRRQACVDAWADAIDAGASSDDIPAACEKLPNGDQVEMYVDGVQERNKRARASFDACTDDPSTCPDDQ